MKEKGSERRGGGGVGLANVVSKTQCASITHATENAYLSVCLHSFTLSNLRAASSQHTKQVIARHLLLDGLMEGWMTCDFNMYFYHITTMVIVKG